MVSSFYSFAYLSVDLYKSVTHISLFMSWKLLNPQEKSEDEDSDFFVISDESADEDDNRLRQEYHTNRPRLRSRQELLFSGISIKPYWKSWKTHPVFFRNFNFFGMSLTDIWKTRPYRNRSVSRPRIHQKLFFDYLLCFG